MKQAAEFRTAYGVTNNITHEMMQLRLIAEELEATLGWSFIPEQVTGKGGLNLAAAMKSEANDGTVIGMAVTETLGYNMAASNSGMTPADYNNCGFPNGCCGAV